MNEIQKLITENLDIWTAADTAKKTGRGRSSSNADKVYGIKKLRELILELAVRGKLVPQDPNDEPASELLKRIQKEKAKLIAEGKIKKEKSLPPITDEEKPFELPKGWEWVRLGNIGKIFNGNSINESEKLEKFTNLIEGRPFIATKDIGYGREEINYKNGVLIPFENNSFRIAHKEAVLICSEGGSAGKKIGITKVDVCFGNKLYANEVLSELVPQFIFYVYQAPYFFSSFSNKMTGIIGGISINEFLTILVPLPSEKEQHRIIAKVDELMELCDQLETQHNNSIEAHEKLVIHFLSTLTRSQDSKEFNDNWHRIASHFDILFTTESSIDALKQTLLQLAVMGKLVPQDPNDEPASELLKRIQKEKAKLIAEGKIKKEKPLAPISDDEKPFELPEGWEWCQMTDICIQITDGTHQTPKYVNSGRPFISAQNVKPFKFMPENHKFVSEGDFENLRKNRIPEVGDILLTRVGAMIGEAAIIDANFEFAFYVSLALLKLPKETRIADFLVYWLNSPIGTALSVNNTLGRGVSAGNLNLSLIRKFVIGLPSINEQVRIFKKIDELIALCDQLKTKIVGASQLQKNIAEKIVRRTLN